jgi:tRNA (mo5U34)-methyltransferase
MIDFQPLVERWSGGPLSRWAGSLQDDIDRHFHSRRYGDLPGWLATLENLPGITPSSIDLDSGTVRVGLGDDATPAQRAQLEECLRKLHPWRKGPFDLFGVKIDTEWRSDWKWDRLLPSLQPLEGRRVLDVGCGSGYHCWRMLGAGAAEVIGIDPTPLFVVQFQALQRYIDNPAAWVLPLGIEQVPGQLEAFDTVFSMGVLYHRRSPIGHLMELRDTLRDGGQLLLETLVIDGGDMDCLVPEGRYARMGNVWFIPSTDMLLTWMRKLGFKNVELVDVTTTTTDEQRSTDWMQFHSLADFLDPEDTGKTIEGYPAPTRAVVSALK